jgi:signal transduction histidine kinase
MNARRMRLALAALAAALVLPSALLVERALRGVAAEEASRHQAVAERVFDEAERALSELVEREEARPVEAWDAADPKHLAALPDDAFVLGYFQIEPDRSVTLPLPARDPAAVDAAAGWLATERPRRVDGGGAEYELKPGSTIAQAPGTTIPMERSLQSLRSLRYAEKDQAAAPSAPPAPKTAYDALSSLNRGAEERQQRQRKLVEKEAKAEAPAAGARAPRMEFEAPDMPRRIDHTRMAVDPLVGRFPDARHLLLYRTVFDRAVALRQGLVLDVDALGDHLRERALGGSRLAGAVLSFAIAADESPPPDNGALRYRHRFAEPFDAWTASVRLPPLDGGSGAGTIWSLAALLALLGGLGLFAVYRMMTVTLAFAERRSNFVAAVTHELKTPLTAVRMYGEMLRDDLVPDPAKRREYYATITAESERLGRLIDNVLEFSRLERGTREMRLAVGDLGPLVEDLAALLRPHAERAGFALHVEVEPDLPPVRFERDALLQVLWNLVDNAVKYAARASARDIAIECRRAGDGVRLAVRDHGPGVAGRQLARIFEPFHRGETELVRTTQGTGLGLALAKSLVERMGGAVAGANAAGGGFEVSIALPPA